MGRRLRAGNRSPSADKNQLSGLAEIPSSARFVSATDGTNLLLAQEGGADTLSAWAPGNRFAESLKQDNRRD